VCIRSKHELCVCGGSVTNSDGWLGAVIAAMCGMQDKCGDGRYSTGTARQGLTCMRDLAGGCGLQVLSVSLNSDHLRPARSTAADISGTNSCTVPTESTTRHSTTQNLWVVGMRYGPAAAALWPEQLRLRQTAASTHLRQLPGFRVHCGTPVSVPGVILAPVVDHLQTHTHSVPVTTAVGGCAAALVHLKNWRQQELHW
jgi:hypothetical protein